jgi:hypothetical protein
MKFLNFYKHINFTIINQNLIDERFKKGACLQPHLLDVRCNMDYVRNNNREATLPFKSNGPPPGSKSRKFRHIAKVGKS